MSGASYICLYKKGITKNKVLHKLIYKTFKPYELRGCFTHVYHLDENKQNNILSNLEKTTFGDLRRRAFEKKKMNRGIYRYTRFKFKKWRVTFKVLGKTKTFGYYKTRREARRVYVQKYTEVYGRSPL